MASSPQHQLQQTSLLSVLYHDIFDYPLTSKELIKWKTKLKYKKPKGSGGYSTVIGVDNYFALKGREEIIEKRKVREKISLKKLHIAKKGATLLSKIPSILFVGITGSLAMNNSKKGSDIDFLVVTKAGTLWTTRLLSYFFLFINGMRVRKAGDREERDRLCLNMWMDERHLYFDKQNIFTSHEIAQIVPLVNKNKTFEKLIEINKWIFRYWPNAIRKQPALLLKTIGNTPGTTVIEKLCFFLQILYMRRKRSIELVSPTRAFFHPFDWGREVMRELNRRGIDLR